jgi:hypothetical protein
MEHVSSWPAAALPESVQPAAAESHEVGRLHHRFLSASVQQVTQQLWRFQIFTVRSKQVNQRIHLSAHSPG